MATGRTANYSIPYPLATDPVNVANDIKMVSESLDILLDSATEEKATEITNALFQIIPLDDMSFYFDGTVDTFFPQYDGETIPLQNPYRVILTINGLIQTPNFADYVSLSPINPTGFVLNTDGSFTFNPIPQPEDKFDGRIMPGAVVNEKERKYPFEALNILMGD